MEYGKMMNEAKQNAKLSFYQNPGYQLERRERKSFILKVDSGSTGVFNVRLREPLIIDRLSDIYLENFTTFHSAGRPGNTAPCSAYVLKIDQFNHQGNSTEGNIFNKLIIPNENTVAAAAGSRKIHKGKKLNYVASINPSTLSKISGTITDLSGSTLSVSKQLTQLIVVAHNCRI